MSVGELLDLLRRRRVLVVLGLVLAIAVAVLSAYRVDGTRLSSRAPQVFETSTVVAIKPGGLILPPQTVPVPTTTLPPPTTVAGAVAPPTTVTPVTTTTALPVAGDFVDSRVLNYSALSVQTAVVAPGFAEAVEAAVPEMDGEIAAVVPLDTNSISITVTGSTPEIASATMRATMAELGQVVDSYARSDAFRFTLEAQVISAASEPHAVASIRSPLTFALVLVFAIVLVWLGLRAVESIDVERKRTSSNHQLTTLFQRRGITNVVTLPADRAAILHLPFSRPGPADPLAHPGPVVHLNGDSPQPIRETVPGEPNL